MTAIRNGRDGRDRRDGREGRDDRVGRDDVAMPPSPLAILQVAGDDVAMGRQLGGLMRELGGFEQTLAYFDGLPGHILGMGRRDLGRRLVIAGIVKALAPGLARLDRARPEALRERTRVFLEALGRPERERLGLVALDATQNAIGLLARAGLSGGSQAEAIARGFGPASISGVTGRAGLQFPGACSSFAVWGRKSADGRLLHARNFDLPDPGGWTRTPAVVFCQPLGRGLRYGYVTTSGADVPGVTAFNEAGLTVTAHTRFHREVSFDGLSIVDLGHLIVRSARTLTEAIAIASRRRVASSWGLVVSSAAERRAICIEVHAGRVAVDCGDGLQEFFCTTNRNQVLAMQPGEVAPSPAWVRYSEGRRSAMRRALEAVEPGRGFEVEDAARLLGSHVAGDDANLGRGLVGGDSGTYTRATGDCLAQSISIQSVVVDPERQTIHVATGDHPTSRGPWTEVRWRWGDAPSMTVRTADEVQARGKASSEGAPYAAGHEGRAYQRFLAASRLEIRRAPAVAVREAMEDAVALLPTDPSFRHLAGGLALRAGDLRGALDHFGPALEHEPSAFRRAELLSWDAKVSRWAGLKERERDRRRALAELLPGPLVGAAMADIERRKKVPKVGVDFQLLTITT